MNESREPRAASRVPDGIRIGEPATCRCGREMVCIASEQLNGGYGGHKYPVGTRYVYKCQGCPRRLEVRWIEKYVPQGEPGGAA